jgi:hypothetical protein
MASPFPLAAWWRDAAPAPQALAAMLRPALQRAGFGVDDVGLHIALPGGAALFLDEVRGRCALFALTGPDLDAAFGPAEQARVAAAAAALLDSLVRDAGALLAWAGTVREEFAGPAIDRFDAAMTGWSGATPLPLSLLDDTAWLRRWSAAFAADIAPQSISAGIAARDDLAPILA